MNFADGTPDNEPISPEEAARHWYYRTIFRVLHLHLRRHRFFEDGKVLADVGCGSGVFLKMLAGRPEARDLHLFGVDPDFDEPTPLDENLTIHPRWPVSERADAVLLMDVLENAEHPCHLLSEAVLHSRNGGLVFITLPAFPTLWSPDAKADSHYRRHSVRSLQEDIEEIADLELVDSHYFFAPVLPFAMLMRTITHRPAGGDLRKLPPVLNGLLKLCCLPELPLMRLNKLGGLSVAAVCRVAKMTPCPEEVAPEAGLNGLGALPEASAVSAPVSGN